MRVVIIRALAGLGLLCSLTVPAAAIDREAFTISKYDLEVRLEPGQQRIGARGKITVRNDSGQAQKVVALQISSSLSWRAIRVGGKTVQFVSQPFLSDIDHTGALSEAIVTLPVEVKAKDSMEIEIGYEGVIPLDATRLMRVGVPEGIARHTSWDQISPSFTAVRGAGYVAWYPIITESADFSEGNSLFEVVDRWKSRVAGSEFKARVEMVGTIGEAPRVMVCTPGREVTSETSRAQQASTECSWMGLGTITPVFAMANYQDQSKPPFYLFSLPGHEAGASTYANALDPATKFVSGWFGAPRAPVAIADLADPNSAPFESGTLLMASMAVEDSKLAGINLVHELVHSALPSSRPWVYEGLAHFAEAMYRQQQGGRQAALDFLGLHRAAFLDSEKDVAVLLQKNAGDKSAGQPLAATFDETYYRSKAAYVWWMLYDMVGEDALKQAIGKYRAAGDNDKDPKYVERLIEAAAKRDLGWFFDDWVYQDRGLPELKVSNGYARPSLQGIFLVSATIENRGGAGAEVPIILHTDNGDVLSRLRVPAHTKTAARIEVGSRPTSITVNDGSVPEADFSDHTTAIRIGPQ